MGLYLAIFKLVKNKISIKKHLVANIGFTKDATHTKIKYKDWFHDLKLMN